MPFDVIGDVHGELDALQALGQELGYGRDWQHPDRRTLMFLGDLIDRGPYSLQVAELVMRLVQEGRAQCVMGNHEYNIVAWQSGVMQPKASNRRTIAQIKADPQAWAPVLSFFRTLPIGIELPDLRIIHACWHVPSLRALQGVLASPFDAHGLREDLPQSAGIYDEDPPHAILMKGFEVKVAEAFLDNDGHMRDRIRAVWWRDNRDLVLTDKPQVFGHYWNLPPIEGHFAPPYPSGHPQLRAWASALAARCPDRGRLPLQGDYACVDFNGYTKAADGKRACVGALRWPEREIVWAIA